jgi:hydrogenase/urease accessory protein HupE
MRLTRLGQLLALLASWVSCVASAHEIRPAYLEIRIDRAQAVHILWKQPVAGELALPLHPQVSAGWLDASPVRSITTDSFLIREWRIVAPHTPMAGQRLSVEGLDKTLTDVLIRIVDAQGDETIHILRPGAASFYIPPSTKTAVPIAEYVGLGVEHIWTGIDHLLFVLGLMLLTPRLRALLKTITAFTLAHSLTLAAATLGLVHAPPAPVEAVIALSILYLAVELVHVREGRPALAQRYPWVIAFTFGLLHGFGFAGALSEVGLPPERIPLALLLFNCGIEIGQVVFVGVVSAVLALLARGVPRFCAGVKWVMPHAIGSLAAFWFIERALVAFEAS